MSTIERDRRDLGDDIDRLLARVKKEAIEETQSGIVEALAALEEREGETSGDALERAVKCADNWTAS